MNFKIFIVFLLPLAIYCVNPIDEPGIRSRDHKYSFVNAMNEYQRIWERAIEITQVLHNQWSIECGKNNVPLGRYVVGFDPYYGAPGRRRKTTISATIRPEHRLVKTAVTVDAERWCSEHSIRRSFDQNGHGIAKSLAGSGGKCNIYPQDGQLNMGPWFKKENVVLKFLDDGLRKDASGNAMRNANGRVLTDGRYVIFRIAFLYNRDGELMSNGDLYPSERPSGFHYVLMTFLNRNDNNPNVLAGYFENRSYLKEFLYNGPNRTTIFKDEPDYKNFKLPLQELERFERDEM